MTAFWEPAPASTHIDERTSTLRFFRWAVGVLVLQSLSLYLLSEWLEHFVIEGVWAVVGAAVLFTVAEAATWPFLYWLAARFHPLLFPLFSFSFSGVLIVILSDVFNDFGATMVVEGVGTGIVTQSERPRSARSSARSFRCMTTRRMTGSSSARSTRNTRAGQSRPHPGSFSWRSTGWPSRSCARRSVRGRCRLLTDGWSGAATG